MQQAVHLGFAPRIRIRHTSAAIMGQIYVPSVNWALMVGCVVLVLGFRHSERLAGAYGLAVAGTMLATTILFSFVVRERLGWPARVAIPVSAIFLVVDVAFFTATLAKIPHGGWVPLLVGLVVFTLMTTWRTGKRIVRDRTVRQGLSLAEFVDSLAKHPPVRAPGAGIYLYARPDVTPPVLLASLKHHDSLHERVLVTSVVVERRPHVPKAGRVEIADLGQGFFKVVVHFGYLDEPNVADVMADQVRMKIGIEPSTVSYFLGRETIRATSKPGMARWREYLYIAMSRNAADPARYFGLPAEQVVDLGVVVDL